MDGRRIFFTGRAFRRASSICAPPFRSTSLSRTALSRWKETGHSTALLVLWERSYLRMTRLLPMQPAHDSWGSNPEESRTSARVRDSWATLLLHSSTWLEKPSMLPRLPFRSSRSSDIFVHYERCLSLRDELRGLPSLSPAVLEPASRVGASFPRWHFQ